MSGAIVHPAAVVARASIGAGSRVWQFASVIREARIGQNCNIGSCAIVDGAWVGDGTTVGHGVSLNPGVHLGRDVFVGPNATFCNDYWPTTSKAGFHIEPLVSGELVTTLVEDGASVGAGAVVLPGTRIGSGAMVAAGAVVNRDVPPGHIFHLDGTIERIDPARVPARMRPASPGF